MIKNTFTFLQGVGEKTEQRLWSRGILDWDSFLASPSVGMFSGSRKLLYDEELRLASERLAQDDASYFSTVMKTAEHWRLFEHFKEDAVCLDIETNGVQHWDGGYPTVVGLYGRGEFRAFIHGEDLETAPIMEWLSGFRYLITFYGTVFDIPFLRNTLPGFDVTMPHFDLCFGGKRAGYSGGLKSVERQLGIQRPQETVGLDGYEAVRLWSRAKRGDSAALELLVKYNREDTVNLMDLAHMIYPDIVRSTGIREYLPQ